MQNDIVTKPEHVPAKTSTLAIVSLVFGILGLFFIGSLVGIITGHLARSEIRKSEGRLEGDAMALTGLITGYIGFILAFIWVALMGGLVVLAALFG
ncbi:DUF4190 domain-containing protein [Pseudoteredinibacter isoporae]|uniref:VIT1/CCC1 family predicted Fe2+/Mn2+ transporter n=1 Tax=Pseudoteredinibacter isoporae TaxID=570281 RepID=A0A7X0MXT7_9GAMM|nr:DUF4190 domain-containing protein [Pseudoteredinibacter isoporae]MBB6522334.1 VIT1/CCC1 family predicted Fe2+/Mn2+ transporter [Pseudoteredinibacter isoporae]NHO87867.1 DUF4190 domain-containing protein [Pseudoteredinibacter isoporae]NIB23802.1 DUF4190 domain-containing protein [Pseudoteredinibacter isoporae]